MKQILTSLVNPKIKEIVALRKKSKDSGKILVEGLREISCALEVSLDFLEVYCTSDFQKLNEHADILAQLQQAKVTLIEVSDEVFEKISFGSIRDGILALCVRPEKKLSDWSVKENGLFLIVESLEKPGNLGAILRSCNGAGVDGVIVTEKRVDLYNPNVIRASLGSVFLQPIAIASNEECFEFLQGNNIKICSAVVQAEKKYTQSDLRGSLAIIFGSEQHGLSSFWQNKSDMNCCIPMSGKVDSLNVSVAAAIFLYEAKRQREG